MSDIATAAEVFADALLEAGYEESARAVRALALYPPAAQFLTDSRYLSQYNTEENFALCAECGGETDRQEVCRVHLRACPIGAWLRRVEPGYEMAEIAESHVEAIREDERRAWAKKMDAERAMRDPKNQLTTVGLNEMLKVVYAERVVDMPPVITGLDAWLTQTQPRGELYKLYPDDLADAARYAAGLPKKDDDK